MSDTPTYHSDRGGETRPRTYQNTATLNKGLNLPRGYTSGGVTVKKGMFVYAKIGKSLNFFNDSKAASVVGPSGGKGGQDGNPSRSNTEYVGVATGVGENGMIQVDWVNRWWQNGKPGFGIGGNWGMPEKGTYKTENKTSWVKLDSVDLKTTFVDPNNPDSDEETPPPPPPGDSGIDTTTLGYAAVAAALIFSTQKKKRR
ncbi:hypothetical protein [Dyadobacter aurulentus]|uniref:hypothetical protein n=1 Tax=Dyadobacter sp. UC 10 TaxID=2605428 RepID=UPI0011F22A0B|nr:hypothetical protein [Dyadobacter sp. UC 10]KAA0992764.1 hypothetical protein FXO21_22595 [Dyadobacter sp. UC 10]